MDDQEFTEQQLQKLRRRFGIGTRVTIFPDNLIVPWRVLSLKELLYFVEELGTQRRVPCLIEDEVFLKCVLDDSLCRRIDQLKAGVVTSVADQILTSSKPVYSAEDFTKRLEQERQRLQVNNAILHEFVKYISIAFPYKPEEIYSMTFDEFCRTLILAESKLFYLGIIKEPFTVVSEEGQEEKGPRPDLKDVWERQHGVESRKTREEEASEIDEKRTEKVSRHYLRMEPPPHPFKEGERDALFTRAHGRQPSQTKELTWRDKIKEQPVTRSPEGPDREVLVEMGMDPNDPRLSPVIKHGPATGLDFQMEELGVIKSLKGHELQDLDVNRYKMVEEAKKIYGPALEYLERKKARARGKKE